MQEVETQDNRDKVRVKLKLSTNLIEMCQRRHRYRNVLSLMEIYVDPCSILSSFPNFDNDKQKTIMLNRLQLAPQLLPTPTRTSQ